MPAENPYRVPYPWETKIKEREILNPAREALPHIMGERALALLPIGELDIGLPMAFPHIGHPFLDLDNSYPGELTELSLRELVEEFRQQIDLGIFPDLSSKEEQVVTTTSHRRNSTTGNRYKEGLRRAVGISNLEERMLFASEYARRTAEQTFSATSAEVITPKPQLKVFHIIDDTINGNNSEPLAASLHSWHNRIVSSQYPGQMDQIVTNYIYFSPGSDNDILTAYARVLELLKDQSNNNAFIYQTVCREIPHEQIEKILHAWIELSELSRLLSFHQIDNNQFSSNTLSRIAFESATQRHLFDDQCHVSHSKIQDSQGIYPALLRTYNGKQPVA